MSATYFVCERCSTEYGEPTVPAYSWCCHAPVRRTSPRLTQYFRCDKCLTEYSDPDWQPSESPCCKASTTELVPLWNSHGVEFCPVKRPSVERFLAKLNGPGAVSS